MAAVCLRRGLGKIPAVLVRTGPGFRFSPVFYRIPGCRKFMGYGDPGLDLPGAALPGTGHSRPGTRLRWTCCARPYRAAQSSPHPAVFFCARSFVAQEAEEANQTVALGSGDLRISLQSPRRPAVVALAGPPA